MGWEEAGVAWSDRAVDWAYLMEPLFTPVYDTLGSALALKSTDSLLDIGCGGGRALMGYTRQCAQVAGIDAADGLLSIARLRVPQADLRHGSLTELPWPDGAFDAVTGVNSFVYADDGGLSEAFRVLKPGGRLGIGFWSDPMDFGWAMGALGDALSPYVGPASTNTPLAMSESGTARAARGGRLRRTRLRLRPLCQRVRRRRDCLPWSGLHRNDLPPRPGQRGNGPANRVPQIPRVLPHQRGRYQNERIDRMGHRRAIALTPGRNTSGRARRGWRREPAARPSAALRLIPVAAGLDPRHARARPQVTWCR